MSSIDIESLSLDELVALAKRANSLKKDLLTADATRLASFLNEFATTVVGERSIETSEKSGWHGIKVYGLPVTVDGVEFSASVTLTDVKASEAAKVALKAAGTTPEADSSDEPDTEAPAPMVVKAGVQK